MAKARFNRNNRRANSPSNLVKTTVFNTNVVHHNFNVPIPTWGFPKTLIEKAGGIHTNDVYSYGIRCHRGISGWVIKSDVSDAYLAIFDAPYQGKKCMQSLGKNRPWYKLLIANDQHSQLGICEGFKDALALYHLGVNVLVTGGISLAFEAYQALKAEFLNLLDQFDPNDLGLFFDIDKKLTTKFLVDHYEIQLIKLLEKEGWEQIQTLPNWQADTKLAHCKDLHDIWLVDQGETLRLLLNKTVNCKNRPMRGVTNNYNATHITNSKFVDVELIQKLVKEHKSTCVKSPMGSGKTYALAKILSDLGLSFVIISPLIVLGRQTANQLKKAGIKVTYRDSLKTGDNTTNVVCCLQSVKPDGKVNFSKRSPEVVVIDELPQVLNILRTCPTLKFNRETVVSTLTKALRESVTNLALGADITQLDVEMLAELTGISTEELGCYHNKNKRNTFKVYTHNSLKDVAYKVNEIIKNNGQVFISVDAQKVASKNAGINLGTWMNCPEEETLIIDSVTTGITGHDAREIVEKEKLELLNKYTLVCCSPAVNSGFNIPPEIYSPDLIVCIHTGCASPDSLIQSTMRVRDLSVPRVLVFSGFIRYSDLPANGAINKGDVKKYFAQQEKENQKATNCKKLKKHAIESGLLNVKNLSLALEYEDLDLSNNIYASIATENIKIIHREKYVLDMLQAQGAIVATEKEIKAFLEVEEIPILEKLTDIRDRNVTKQAKAIIAAPDITKKDAETLREMPSVTETQKRSLDKQVMQDYVYKYKDVDVEDAENWQLGKTPEDKRYYQLTKGIGYALEREEMTQRKLTGKSNFNPGLMLKEEQTEVVGITQKDVAESSNLGILGILNRIGLIKAIDYAKEGKLKEFYLLEYGAHSELPEPLTALLAKARIYKKQLKIFFGLPSSLFREQFKQEIKLIKALFKLVGVEFTDKRRVRVTISTDPPIVRQITIYERVKHVRSKAKIKKFLNAQYAHETEIISLYRTAKELARLGKLIISKSSEELLQEIDNYDVLIQASKYLGTDHGLSKTFELLRKKLRWDVPNPSEISLVTPQNIPWVTNKIETWISQKTKIGLDTETYESLIHKNLCYQNKNGKWKFDNPWTGKIQDIKPGLDQNNNLVRIISLSDGVNTFVIDLSLSDMPAIPLWLKPLWGQLEKLLKTNLIIGHNLKFDTSSLRKYGLIIKHPYDTLNTTKLAFLDCGAGRVLPGGYSLANVYKTFFGKIIDKTEQKSNWGAKQLTSNQLIYGGGDAELPVHLYPILEDFLANPGKWSFPEFANEQGQHANRQLIGLENRTIYHATEMQFRGVPFDIPQAKVNLNAYKAEKQRLRNIWEHLDMDCEPEQAIQVAAELNRRYGQFGEHPLLPEDLDISVPTLDQELSGTGRSVIDDHPDIPELQLLKAYREKITVINQISKSLLSAEIHDGVCKTEYGILSGTGRFSCGGRYSLGAPNLQALIKSVESNHFGYVRGKEDVIKYWESGVGVGKLTKENTRSCFTLTSSLRAFLTEDANASHGRLAIGFGRDEFGKKAMEDDTVDNHSSFAIKALKVMLQFHPNCLDNFPKIKDFVVTTSEDKIGEAEVTKQFKKIDATYYHKRFRDAAKTLFYSVLNGAQADKMRKVMSGAVGLPLDVVVGQKMFNAYWGMYQGIWEFIQKQKEYAETNAIQFGAIEFNITELPDGTKLAFAKERGGVALTKLTACQWSRCEATAIKRILESVEQMPEEWGVELINTVHDEVSITCKREYWVEANKLLSDEFATQYQIYLQGFVPSDEPWEAKLASKLKDKPNYCPTGWADK